MKCLQFQDIKRGVDISNYYSYETFFTKSYESNTWLYRRKRCGTLFIVYEIPKYCQSQKAVWAH